MSRQSPPKRTLCSSPPARAPPAGSSYGALLALHLAAERPAQVAGLVLASPALELDSRAWALLTAAQQRALLGGSAATIESGLIDCDTEVQGPSAVKIHFFREGRRLALPTKPGSVQAACPVRILHGSRDKVVPLESSLRLVRQLASDDVTMTVLKDAEHRLHRPRELEALAAAVLHLWGQLARRSG
jgi:alpha-beta hydrolase superfamily lysophospholipase